ncbi:MAG: hypothetical protein FJX84_10210, partial [Bacteroidetes bacterium]|nr:hypothetical protein [Bacteroidota bacterium]
QTGNGCNASDTHLISIYADPVVTLNTDPNLCIGNDISISASTTGGTPNSINNLTWFAENPNGPINPLLVQGPSTATSYVFNLNSDTTIFVNVVNTGFGCDLASDTIIIDALNPAIAAFSASSTSQSFFNPTFSFFNESVNATDYIWDLGECDPQLPINELFATPSFNYNQTSIDIIDYTYGCPPGNYLVTLYATNQGYCADSTSLYIAILSDIVLYVPNSFTPDDNSRNEYFFPFFNDSVSPNGYVFRIYDRWGEIIFETDELPDIPTTKNNTKGSWDGYSPIQNKPCQDGTYIWEIIYGNPLNNDRKKVIGHVTLIR